MNMYADQLQNIKDFERQRSHLKTLGMGMYVKCMEICEIRKEEKGRRNLLHSVLSLL